MSKLNTVLADVIIAVMGLGLSVPAAAQFEVAPDHFPDSAAAQAKPQIGKQDRSLNNRIAELQSELDGYQWQINQHASALETARRLADGPGGEGEFAPVFIDEYLLRYRELEQLKRNVAPWIRLAQDSIRQLESQVGADSSPTHTSGKQSKRTQQPIVIGSVSEKAAETPVAGIGPQINRRGFPAPRISPREKAARSVLPTGAPVVLIHRQRHGCVMGGVS